MGSIEGDSYFWIEGHGGAGLTANSGEGDPNIILSFDRYSSIDPLPFLPGFNFWGKILISGYLPNIIIHHERETGAAGKILISWARPYYLPFHGEEQQTRNNYSCRLVPFSSHWFIGPPPPLTIDSIIQGD